MPVFVLTCCMIIYIVHTALGPPSEAAAAASCAAGELTARVVLVLARHPYTSAFASVCEHIAELILEEVTALSVEAVGVLCLYMCIPGHFLFFVFLGVCLCVLSIFVMLAKTPSQTPGLRIRPPTHTPTHTHLLWFVSGILNA